MTFVRQVLNLFFFLAVTIIKTIIIWAGGCDGKISPCGKSGKEKVQLEHNKYCI